MPELPDVEVLKRYVDATSLHQKIKDVEVRSKKILNGISENSVRKKLKNRKFISADRRGKYLCIRTDGDSWLVMHFGMTGDLEYSKNDIKSGGYRQMLIHFPKGYSLSYISKRKLGKITVTNDIESFLNDRKLGPDAAEIKFEQFVKNLNRGRSNIKKALMNQKFLSGIGNVYSDEILFQSRIHPESSVKAMSDEHFRTLYDSMKEVFGTSIKNGADPAALPDGYLLKERREGIECPRCDGRIRRKRLSARSSYFCPDCQQKIT